MHLLGFSSVQKETKKALEGLGTTLRHELKNLVRFRRASPTVVGVFLILMRFIDPRIFDSNDIHGPHPGPQENLQIGGERCAISQIWPKFREMLGENPDDIHL